MWLCAQEHKHLAMGAVPTQEQGMNCRESSEGTHQDEGNIFSTHVLNIYFHNSTTKSKAFINQE